jgi:ribonuclease HII
MLNYRYNEDHVLEVGIDEVGRGSLFGRLYVGAVVFPIEKAELFDQGASLNKIKDSKKLSKRKRDILYDYIKEIAIDWTTSYAEADEIDEVNVLQADLNAMRRAIDNLYFTPERVLIDGDRNIALQYQRPDTEYITIVQGDTKYLNIAAASIIAKVEHDRWIQEVCSENPTFDSKYGLLSNMGYGTASHMKGLKEHGITPFHRRSFRPVGDAAGWIGSD